MSESKFTLPRLYLEALRRLFADEAIPLAGNIAFRTIFSLFPFLIFLTALAGFFGTAAQAEGLVNFLLDVAPEQIVKPLAVEIRSILTVPRTGLLSLGALLTLWSAMAGVDSVRVGLNRAYDLREARPVWRLYLLNIIVVIGAALLLIVVSFLTIVLPLVLTFAARFMPGRLADLSTLNILRYPLAVILLFLGLHVAHRILPARRMSPLRVMPGVALTVAVWIGLTAAFSEWLQRFNSFASTYASLSGLFAAMFFIYLAALALIFGGEVNRVLELHRASAPSPGS